MYTRRTNPTMELMSADVGYTKGLPRKAVATDQSKEYAPIPRPLIPDPSFCAESSRPGGVLPAVCGGSGCRGASRSSPE